MIAIAIAIIAIPLAVLGTPRWLAVVLLVVAVPLLAAGLAVNVPTLGRLLLVQARETRGITAIASAFVLVLCLATLIWVIRDSGGSTTLPNHGFSVSNDVRPADSHDWANEIDARPGDHVEYLIRVANEGGSPVRATVVRDALPPHVRLVSESCMNTVRLDIVRPCVNNIVGGGIEFPFLGSNSTGYFKFEAAIPKDLETLWLSNAANVDFDGLELNDESVIFLPPQGIAATRPGAGDLGLRVHVRSETDRNWDRETYAKPGGKLFYRVEVRNRSDHALRRIHVSLTFSPYAWFRAADADVVQPTGRSSASRNPHGVTFRIPRLPPAHDFRFRMTSHLFRFLDDEVVYDRNTAYAWSGTTPRVWAQTRTLIER